jgi:Bacterial protein of unknown function (DUF937)
MNLVSTIMQLLAPAIINKIAGSLGLGQGLAGKAIAAALPAILAALTGAASKSGGGSALSSVLARQDPGLLGNLASMIGGPNQQTMINGGTSALSSLLGGSSTNALAGAVGKFAGIDSSQSSSLMGLLAPVVLGQLAQTQKSSGLDAGGLVNLLNGQKSNIAAAMPPGFSDLLAGTGLLDSIAGSVKPAAPQVSHATPDEGSSLSKWLLPLALGALGLYLLSSYGCDRPAEKTMAPVEKPAATAPAEPAPAATAPAPVAAPAADLSGVATKALSGLMASLGTITDEASAKAAVPGLQDAAKQIDGLKIAAAALSGDAKKPIAMLVAGALPGITSAVERAVGIPGAGAILTPLLGPVVANLESLSK